MFLQEKRIKMTLFQEFELTSEKRSAHIMGNARSSELGDGAILRSKHKSEIAGLGSTNDIS